MDVLVPDKNRAVQLDPRVRLEKVPVLHDPDAQVGRAPGAPQHRVCRESLDQTAGAGDPPGCGLHRPRDPSGIGTAATRRDTIRDRPQTREGYEPDSDPRQQDPTERTEEEDAVGPSEGEEPAERVHLGTVAG